MYNVNILLQKEVKQDGGIMNNNLDDEKISFDSEGDNQEELLQEKSSECEELSKKFDALQDEYVRACADFDNIKRRMEKEKLQGMLYANESLGRDLLEVVDALEAATAVEASNEESLKIKEGVLNTLDLFKKKLEKNMIKEIEENESFDPNLHEAMFHVDSDDHESGAVVAVLQKGYKINERVLRPVKVSVAK